MRENKFRAWDKENKCMCDIYKLDTLGDGYCIVAYKTVLGEQKTNKLEIMQYTELKNFWEFDIVQDHIGIGIIEYANKYAAFRVNYQDGTWKWFYDYLDSEFKTVEKIGNKFETPELLKEKKDE